MGKIVKLRETPYSLNYQTSIGNLLVATLIASGMVKILRIGRSAAKFLSPMGRIWKRFRD